MERKKRPSYWKHLNKIANPRRVAPDLLPTAVNSSGRSVKCSSNSFDVHVRFIPFSFLCLYFPYHIPSYPHSHRGMVLSPLDPAECSKEAYLLPIYTPSTSS